MRRQPKSIEVQRIISDSTSIRCEFSYPRKLNGFFFDDYHLVEYDTDIKDVPESILPIPWLASICPLAWATGVDIELPVLDERFAESLDDVRRELERMYPRFMQGGEVRCRELVTNDDRSNFNNEAMLFSGGVDALATYYRHRDESPALVSVNGFDVGLDETDTWNEKKRRIDSFARMEGVESFVIRTNMMSMHEDFMLDAYFRRFLSSDWYNAVQHGIGLTGLCAPLAFTKQFGTLYMSDSASVEYDHEVGNHPSIVNNVRWGSTVVRSDGFELTRQQKIDLFADFIEEEGVELHTCPRSGGGNCSRCEKCLRTITGLVLAGLDPNEHGFEVEEDTFKYARKQFEEGNWKIGEHSIFGAYYWRELRDCARERDDVHPGAEAFVKWLERVDIDAFVEPTETADYRAYKITRQLPHSTTVHSVRRRLLDAFW